MRRRIEIDLVLQDFLLLLSNHFVDRRVIGAHLLALLTVLVPCREINVRLFDKKLNCSEIG